MKRKPCKNCGENLLLESYYKDSRNKDGKRSVCIPCSKLLRPPLPPYIRRERKKHEKPNKENEARLSRKWSKINRYKGNVVCKVYRAIKKGKLKKQPCIFCGSTDRIEAHHNDYEKPFEVVWLCNQHHKIWHYVLKRVKPIIIKQCADEIIDTCVRYLEKVELGAI